MTKSPIFLKNRVTAASLAMLIAPIAVGCASSPSLAAVAPTPIESVNPMVGTDGHGHMYPGATVPFGMVQLSPDTRTEGWDGCSGYHYDDKVIQGFTRTHLSGTGGADLGDILVMPMVGAASLNVGTPGNGYASAFSHSQEQASPGYYKVYLQTPGVLAEMTATPRCGLHRYTFPASDASHFIVDLTHGIGNTPYDCGLTVENSTTISGYKKTHGWASDRSIFFVMQFSKPFQICILDRNDQQTLGAPGSIQGDRLKICMTFPTINHEVVLVKVGISGTSIEAARKNLEAELPGFDFDATRAAAERAWSKQLDAVQIQTPDLHVRRTFYTNLYETMLAPTLYNDDDGAYMGNDHQVHPNPGFQNYTELSIWDTYRAEQPWLALTQPKIDSDIVRGMLAQYHENGSAHTTPIWPLWGNETWCMIGYHSVDIMTDAYLKGIAGFNPEEAYQAMRDTALFDRNDMHDYEKIGYIPSVRGNCSTSKTLEYAYDDWCIARMAQVLGHAADAEMFYKRAGNYRNVFDRTVQFMRGREADGTWRRPFVANGLVNDEYTEADAWQYAFNVQQDLPGLIKLYGGDKGFIQRMDAMFDASPAIRSDDPDLSGLIGQMSQGDEQCHHVTYLYDYAGAPYKTQMRVRQVMAQLYNDTPLGQCGNDDCGQMSAWYTFSALGFYPVNPASGVYAIGSPAVSRATIRLDSKYYGGRAFTVIADGNSPKNIYIQSASLNGWPLNRAWITYKEITAGGTLHFVMGPTPNTAWASAASVRPPATMPADFHYAVLPKPSDPADAKPTVFRVPIRIACGSDTAIGDFLPDFDMLDGDTHGADTTVDVFAPNAAPERVYQIERYASDFTYTFPVPKDRAYRVRLHFAEIFDNSAGTRIENVSINGQPSLTNFDIYAAGNGIDKAIVKEFDGIHPDAHGKISIRISATPGSPDQNAKINGIEILPE